MGAVSSGGFLCDVRMITGPEPSVLVVSIDISSGQSTDLSDGIRRARLLLYFVGCVII